MPRSRCRFLNDISDDLIVKTDRSFPDETSSKEHRQAHEDRVKNHLASIRALLKK
jgi:hypothetical protein